MLPKPVVNPPCFGAAGYRVLGFLFLTGGWCDGEA